MRSAELDELPKGSRSISVLELYAGIRPVFVQWVGFRGVEEAIARELSKRRAKHRYERLNRTFNSHDVCRLVTMINAVCSRKIAVTTTTPAVIHILHSSPILNSGLAAILDAQPGWVVDRREPASSADCIIVTDYVDGLRRLAQRRDRLDQRRVMQPVVVVTSQVREAEVQRLLVLGAFGYVSANATAGEVVEAISAACRGQRFLSMSIASSIADGLAFARLTRRELEVVELLASGMCNKAIAACLDVTPGTVKSHLRTLFDKLGARTRMEATLIAADRGLVQSLRSPRRDARAPGGLAMSGDAAVLQ